MPLLPEIYTEKDILCLFLDAMPEPQVILTRQIYRCQECENYLCVCGECHQASCSLSIPPCMHYVNAGGDLWFYPRTSPLFHSYCPFHRSHLCEQKLCVLHKSYTCGCCTCSDATNALAVYVVNEHIISIVRHQHMMKQDILAGLARSAIPLLCRTFLAVGYQRSALINSFAALVERIVSKQLERISF
jgi:hypothetical protein